MPNVRVSVVASVRFKVVQSVRVRSVKARPDCATPRPQPVSQRSSAIMMLSGSHRTALHNATVLMSWLLPVLRLVAAGAVMRPPLPVAGSDGA